MSRVRFLKGGISAWNHLEGSCCSPLKFSGHCFPFRFWYSCPKRSITRRRPYRNIHLHNPSSPMAVVHKQVCLESSCGSLSWVPGFLGVSPASTGAGTPPAGEDRVQADARLSLECHLLNHHTVTRLNPDTASWTTPHVGISFKKKICLTIFFLIWGDSIHFLSSDLQNTDSLGSVTKLQNFKGQSMNSADTQSPKYIHIYLNLRPTVYYFIKANIWTPPPGLLIL